jgi:hypothetical protein
MPSPAYTDKFVAFIDILGFKDMVVASEGDAPKLTQLLELVAKLGNGTERSNFEKYGPICCPESPRLVRDLDYCVTQISDCVIISAEASPAGLINLIHHCWQVTIRLLQIGILCRGFVTRGLIYHTPTQVIGPGYQNAYGSERTVTAFKRKADEVGTPFVEVDDAVVEYIDNQSDKCVKEIFARLTEFDGSKVALFPFKRLNHDFIVGGISGQFVAEEHFESVNNIRKWIADMKAKIHINTAGADEKARSKTQHYLDALDKQLFEIDETEKAIRMFGEPAVKLRLGDIPKDKA